MTESIHDRLDREAQRLRADQADGATRVSDSFINGVEHAANIAYRMSAPSEVSYGIGPSPCAYCGSREHIERECDKQPRSEPEWLTSLRDTMRAEVNDVTSSMEVSDGDAAAIAGRAVGVAASYLHP